MSAPPSTRPFGLLVVVGDQIGERHAAGDGDRFGGGAHGARDKTQSAGRGILVGSLARDFGRSQVQLVGLSSDSVFGEDDFGAAEAVRLDDIRPCFVIGAMNVDDDVGPRQDQIFIAALEGRAAEIVGGELTLLQHCSHGSVEHENTSCESVFEGLPTDLPGLVDDTVILGLRDYPYFTWAARFPNSCGSNG